MRTRAALAALLVLALALPLRAQDDGSLFLDLGGGASATRAMVRGLNGALFQTWTARGFTFGGSAQLARQATWFARVRTGRIVAGVNAGPSGYTWRTMMGPAGIVYTDDLGAHWQVATFESSTVPSVIAFDPASLYGVAVGEGHVWSSDDGGGHWRERRSDDARYLGVVVTGHCLVLRAASGDVLFSRDGGFELRTLATDVDATAEMDGDAIVVHAGGHAWRVLPNGDLRSL